MSPAPDALRASWLSLVTAVGGDEAAATGVLTDLDGRYSEPQRVYHTWPHIRHVHQVMEWILNRVVASRPAIELAVFFHDAIYDPAPAADQPDNETASAAFATAACGLMALPDDLITEVSALILSTRDHRPSGREQEVLCDADLAILASDPATYDVYRRAVRVEYGHLDDATFSRGRHEVLDGLLARDRIYTTSVMHDRGESAARSNLRRELAALER
jgi:predicted metal-dependent HD superfamily phosphohydrolase